MYLVAARLVAAPIEQSGEGGSTNLSRIDGLETGSKFWLDRQTGKRAPEESCDRNSKIAFTLRSVRRNIMFREPVHRIRRVASIRFDFHLSPPPRRGLRKSSGVSGSRFVPSVEIASRTS
jgi:hypothetical protein